MADINIVRKTPAILPWLIGLGLVLLAIALWVAWDGDLMPGARGSMPGRSVPAQVAAYQNFVESSGTIAPGPSHDYTATGIRHLAAALRVVATPEIAANPDLFERLEAFEHQANRLQADPQSAEHADIVKNVFVSAVDVMEYTHEERASGSSVLETRLSEVRQSAENIDTRRLLLDQHDQIARFFKQSSDTVALLDVR